MLRGAIPETDMDILAFSTLGFSMETIGAIMGDKPRKISERRTALKRLILSSEGENIALYRHLFREMM